MRTVKINISKANLPLDQKTYNKYAQDKNTINLRNTPIKKELIQRRIERKQFNTARSILKGAVLPFITFMVLVIASLYPNTSEAFFWNSKVEIETPIESIIDREEYCNNYLIRANYELYLTDCKEYHKVTKDILDDEQGLNTVIKSGKYHQPVIVYDTRINYMIEQGYSLTEIIDLNTILTMECNRYDGKCVNSSDIGNFQINRIAHRKAYLRSKELFYNSKALFKYQLAYIKTEIIDNLNNRFCGWKYTNSNEVRFKCLARNYNGNTHIYSNGHTGRYNYMMLAWAKRELVARYIVDNYPLLTN